jgi:predicted short-subunit dehydrogenase-like oxidoreductase (DUF2520 family)
MRRLDIVGGGAVGRTLGRLLHEAGATRIGRVAGRSLASAREAVAFIGAGEPGVDFDTLGRVDLLMLSVGDDAIGAVASALAASGAVLDGAVIFHCSGALSAEVLEPVRAKGACTASLHPVKTFAEPDAAATGFRRSSSRSGACPSRSTEPASRSTTRAPSSPATTSRL